MRKLITILVPAYNEEEVLNTFHSEVSKQATLLPEYEFELLFVNDGSKDNTLGVLKNLKEKDKRVSILSLSRNFGKEIAMAAGLDHVKGDAVIIMDADLQDPPELIPTLIAKWEEGYDDVYAQRISRRGETIVKKSTSYLFYRLLSRLSRVEIQKDTGDFRLLSRKAIEALKKYRETTRYTKGLFSLIGMKKTSVPFHRLPRVAGKTKWNYFGLIGLAIEGITSFTTAPLRVSTYLGVFFAFVAFIYMIIIIAKTILYGDPVQGYPSMISVVLFLGGLQLFSLGILGEYIGRIFLETKKRPLYIIDNYESFEKKEV